MNSSSDYNSKLLSDSYFNKISILFEKKQLTKSQYDHFMNRGLTIIRPKQDFGLEYLGKYIPELVIGSSKNYVSKMKIPYQSTSFVATKSSSSSDSPYIYKIHNFPRGGIKSMMGGKRKIGDTIYSATHRILFGHKAIIFSADNLMINSDSLFTWDYFARELKPENQNLYNDIERFFYLYKNQYYDLSTYDDTMYFIIIARSASTFKRLKILDWYEKHKIRLLTLDKERINGMKIKVIFLTNMDGFEYSSKKIEESDFIKYIQTGDTLDLKTSMIKLRNDYNIEFLLNDGGRIMSNGIRDLGLLAEERVTLESFPGEGFFNNEDLDSECILGYSGLGIDNGEIEGTILTHSYTLGNEKLNVYSYPLEDKCVLG